MSHLAYDIRRSNQVQTAVPKGIGLTMNKPTNFSKNPGADEIVIDIKRRRLNMKTIVHIYDRRVTDTGERPARTLTFYMIFRQWGGSTVLVGDFDAHRQCRDLRCTERRKAVHWEPIIGEYGW